MNFGRVCAHESTDSSLLFSFVIKRRYEERRYESYKILKLQNSFVIRVIRGEVLRGIVGKYYGEKKLKRD